MYRHRSVHCAGEEASEHRRLGKPQPSLSRFAQSDITVNPLPPRMYSGYRRADPPATPCHSRCRAQCAARIAGVAPCETSRAPCAVAARRELAHPKRGRTVHSIDTRRVHIDAFVVVPKDDFPKAALKHLQDAQALLKSNRFDGAAYLAGYVVECARKTMIEVERKNVPHIHDLSQLQSRLQALAVVTGSHTGQLYVAIAQAINQIHSWIPEMRYREPSVAAPVAGSWLAEADDVYKKVIGSLTLAGLI